MSKKKPKPPGVKNGKEPAAKTPAPGTPAGGATPAIPTVMPPLFRKVDWLALAIAFGVVWIVYFLTLAPNQTLQDSGELCTAAFYGGIPHPPGYPFWAIYSWLWTRLLPIGSVAWRVEVGESLAAAMACGLVAFMVSRGSSLLMEGIADLKELTGKWASAICLVSGVVAGLLLGLGGVMWSESVAINRISLFGVPWVMIVLLCLLRWIYAPHQRRYLFCAMFCFGICATIHQTLLCAAMGIEAAVAAVQPRLGRDLFLGNSIVYAAGLILNQLHFTTVLNTAPMVLVLYHAVGIASLAAWIGLAAKTRALGTEWKAVLVMGLLWLAGASFYFYEPIAGMSNPPMQWGYPRTVEGFWQALSRGQYEKANPTDLIHDPMRFVMQLGMLVGDIAGEFNWVVVFLGLVPLLFLSRMKKRERSWMVALGSIYLCIGVLLIVLMNPSSDRQAADLIRVFFASSHGVVAILAGYGLALLAAYLATHYQRIRFAALLLGGVLMLPALLTFKNGIASIIAGGVAHLPPQKLLLLFLCLVATFALTAAAARGFARISPPSVSTANDRWWFRGWAAAALSGFTLSVALGFFGEGGLTLAQARDGLVRVFAPQQSKLPVLAGLLVLGVTAAFLVGLLVYRQRAPLALTLGLFAMMPLGSGLAHWGLSEQRNHWFGYWFGHDMFTPPFPGPDGKLTYDPKLREQMLKDPERDRFIYPEMTRDAIVYGGTDPGRFNPTYMIFCESFIPDRCKPKADQKFDRRDCYLITQNALADPTYLMYIRAHYNKSDQVQYDSPFFQELLRGQQERALAYHTNFVARLANRLLDKPFLALGDHLEKQRRAGSSFFKEPDFKDLSVFVTKLRSGGEPAALSNYLYENLSRPAQALMNGAGDESQLRRALAEDLNALLERELVNQKRLKELAGEKNELEGKLAAGSAPGKIQKREEQVEQEIARLEKIGPLYDAGRFRGVELKETTKRFLAQNPQLHTRIRLNRLLLEEAYPRELALSPGGVYPDREILIATPQDSEKCFREYFEDVQRRLQMNPPQLKPGEDVKVVDNKVQVSGQVAVMSLNALLTKVMFDKNPDHEFFIEESLPLDWMYPHLTPFGIIMKINRQPLPALPEEVFARDHEFWTQYSERLIGNWIAYDTPVKDIVAFVEKVYLRHDFSGFKGDPGFVRDDQAQKSFSKLRSSIGGVYAWRLGPQCPPEFRPQNAVERERLRQEADFTFRQALAFCPYNAEAVFRYVQLLAQFQRFEDARLIAETCLRLDPYNGQVAGLVQSLRSVSRQAAEFEQTRNTFQQLKPR